MYKPSSFFCHKKVAPYPYKSNKQSTTNEYISMDCHQFIMLNTSADICCFCVCVYFCGFSPVPTISWKKVDGASFTRKVDINKASGVLEIPYFQQEDAGMYECVAENSRGKNSVKGKLSYYGEQERGLPVFDLKLTLLHTSQRLKKYLMPSTCQSSSSYVM